MRRHGAAQQTNHSKCERDISISQDICIKQLQKTHYIIHNSQLITNDLRGSNKKRILARTNEMVTGKAKRRNRAKAYLQQYVEFDFASITKPGGIAAVRSRFAFC